MIYWETQLDGSGNITQISPYLNTRSDKLGIPDLGFNFLFCKIGNASGSWTYSDTIVNAAQSNGYYVIAEPADNTSLSNFSDFAQHLTTHYINNHGFAGVLCIYERDESQKTTTGYTTRTKIIETFDDCGDIYARDVAGAGYKTSATTDKNLCFGAGTADQATPQHPLTAPATYVSTNKASGRKSRYNLRYAHHKAKHGYYLAGGNRLTFGTHQWLLDNSNGIGYTTFVEDGPNAAGGNPVPGMYRFKDYMPDVWAIQSYPEGLSSTTPVRFIRPYAEMREYIEVFGASPAGATCLMTIIPYYPANYGTPSVAQHRNMFFQAIAGGAKAIAWYNMTEMLARDAQSVPIRQDIARCNSLMQLRALSKDGTVRDGDTYEKIFLNGVHTWHNVSGTVATLAASSPGYSRSYTAVQCSSFSYGNTVVCIIFNAHSTSTFTNLTVPLNTGIVKVTGQSIDTRQKTNVRLAQGALWASSALPTVASNVLTIPSIAPYEVMVIQMDLGDVVTPPAGNTTSRMTLACASANKTAANAEALTNYGDSGNTFDVRAYTTGTTYGSALSYFLADSRLTDAQATATKASTLITYYQFENARVGRMIDTNSEFLHSRIGEVVEYADIRTDLDRHRLTPTDSANCLGWWHCGAQSKVITSGVIPAKNGDDVTKLKPWYGGGDFDQATAANMPVAAFRSINNLASLQFKDGDTFMEWVGGKTVAKNRSGLTISMVIRADNTTSDQNLIHITTPTAGASRASIRLITGGNVMLLARALDADTLSYITTAGAPITAGNWYHLMGTFNYSTKTGEIFVNNVSSLSATFTAMTAGNTSNTDSITGPLIGREAAGTRFFNGLIAHVAIWNGVMSVGNRGTLHTLLQAMYGL
jgi:hypothetical protein